MAIAKVGNVGTNADTSNFATTFALTGCTFSAGNLIVLRVSVSNGTTLSSVSDSAGNTWSVAINQSTSGDMTSAIAYTPATTGMTSGTITATFSTSAYFLYTHIAEFSGVATSTPLDQTHGANATFGTAYSSGATATTSQANELLVGIATNTTNGPTSTPGSGWTEETDPGATTHQGYTDGYQIVSATGTYAYSGTWSANTDGPVAIATFKAAVGVAAGEELRLATLGVGA